MSNSSRTIRYLILGNKRVFNEYYRAVKMQDPTDHEPIANKEPLDAVKMPVISDVIYDSDINGDGVNDKIERRSYRIGYGTRKEPYKWINFFLVYFGGAHETPDMADATVTLKEPAAAQNLEESAKNLYASTNDKCPLNVTQAIYSLMVFCYGTLGYNNVVIGSGVQGRNAVRAEEIRQSLPIELGKEIAFSIPFLNKTLDSSDINRSLRYAMHDSLNPMPAEKRLQLVMKIGRAHGLYKEANDLLDGDKLPVPHDALYEKYLAALGGNKKLAQELRSYAEVIEYQKREGGLFFEGEDGFIATANGFARELGYENYAEFEVERLHGLTVSECKSRLEKFLLENHSRLHSALRDVHGASYDAKVVNERTIAGLLRRPVDTKPSLSVKDAVSVSKRFFKDMGIDLDKLPYGGEIVLDVYSRKDKTETGYYTEVGDGRSGWLAVNYEDNRVGIEDLANLIHETGHLVHSHFKSGFPGGDVLRSYFSFPSWDETFATSLEKVVISPEFVKKYLSSYEGFADSATADIAVGNSLYFDIWWSSITALRALWEINLYEDHDSKGRYRPMQERVDYWTALGIKYLGYKDMGVPISVQNVFYDHPVFRPLQHISYSVGANLRTRIADGLVGALRDRSPHAMKRVFSKIGRVLENPKVYKLTDAEKIIN